MPRAAAANAFKDLIASASAKFRTPPKFRTAIPGFPSDIVSDPPQTHRDEQIAVNTPLAWRDHRTSHYFIALCNALEVKELHPLVPEGMCVRMQQQQQRRRRQGGAASPSAGDQPMGYTAAYNALYASQERRLERFAAATGAAARDPVAPSGRSPTRTSTDTARRTLHRQRSDHIVQRFGEESVYSLSAPLGPYSTDAAAEADGSVLESLALPPEERYGNEVAAAMRRATLERESPTSAKKKKKKKKVTKKKTTKQKTAEGAEGDGTAAAMNSLPSPATNLRPGLVFAIDENITAEEGSAKLPDTVITAIQKASPKRLAVAYRRILQTMLLELRNVERQGAVVGRYTYAVVVERCYDMRLYEAVLDLAKVMRDEGIEIGRNTFIKIVAASAEVRPEETHLWLQRAVGAGIAVTDTEVCKAQLRAFARLGREADGLAFFKQMRAQGAPVDIGMFHAVLFCCRAHDTARRVWRQMVAAGFTPVAYTLALALRASKATPSGAEDIWKAAAELGVQPSAVCYRTLAATYAGAGMVVRAAALWRVARNDLDTVDYDLAATVLRGFLHDTVDVAAGSKHGALAFDVYTDAVRAAEGNARRPPSPHLFGKMADIARKGCDVETFQKVLADMKRLGVPPNRAVEAAHEALLGTPYDAATPQWVV